MIALVLLNLCFTAMVGYGCFLWGQNHEYKRSYTMYRDASRRFRDLSRFMEKRR